MELEIIFPEDKIRKLSDSDWRYRIMFDKEPQDSEMRDCVKRLLDFAERQDVLDAGMLARLGNEDYDQFQSAIHELAVAEFLSYVGSIDWHPPGRDLRIGEFNLSPEGYKPIFVEVKTIFDSLEERKGYNNWNTLREVAHSVFSPFHISAEITRLECDVVPKHFRAWLQRQVTSLKGVLTQLDQQQQITFKDKSEDGSITEIEADFVKCRDDDLPTSCGFTSGGLSNLRKRMIEVIDGALGQLPDNQPTLVVIASPGWSLGKNEMLAAMFSPPKITYKMSTEPVVNKQQEDLTLLYDLEGIVQPAIRTRLSAVGAWHHKWTKEPQGSLEIYHNPLCGKQIPHHALEAPNVCQLVPKERGTMEWTPSRPLE